MKSLRFAWRPGKLMHHSSNLLGWMLLRASSQTITVLLLARMLGAQPYGQVVSVIAIASFLTPFTGLGLSHMVLRNSSKDPANEAIYFSIALHWWLRSLLPCILIAIVLAWLLLPNTNNLPFIGIGAAIAAEITAVSLTELRSRHFQAQQKTAIYGAINAGLPIIRLIALGTLFLLPYYIDTLTVLWAYTVSGLLYTLLLWLAIPSTANAKTVEPMTVRDGIPFSLAVFASRLQSEFNKPILAQSNFSLAGSYNVAQRVVDIFSLPLIAFQESLWPRLHAAPNPKGQLYRTGLALLIFALTLALSMWLIAPLLPVFFGESFNDTVTVLQALAWLPILQVFRALLNFNTIYHGRMQQIGWTYTLGGGVSIIAVSILVPLFGMTGAILSSYAAEVAMIAFLLAGSLWKIKT